MTMRAHSAITVTLLAPLFCAATVGTAFAEEPSAAKQSNTELLREELRDTETRRQHELDSRVKEIEAQAETIRQLTQRQAEYIEQLKAKIDALETQDAAQKAVKEAAKETAQ
jgi:flagellar motility protein MotE (MotC chaperone)